MCIKCISKNLHSNGFERVESESAGWKRQMYSNKLTCPKIHMNKLWHKLQENEAVLILSIFQSALIFQWVKLNAHIQSNWILISTQLFPFKIALYARTLLACGTLRCWWDLITYTRATAMRVFWVKTVRFVAMSHTYQLESGHILLRLKQHTRTVQAIRSTFLPFSSYQVLDKIGYVLSRVCIWVDIDGVYGNPFFILLCAIVPTAKRLFVRHKTIDREKNEESNKTKSLHHFGRKKRDRNREKNQKQVFFPSALPGVLWYRAWNILQINKNKSNLRRMTKIYSRFFRSFREYSKKKSQKNCGYEFVLQKYLLTRYKKKSHFVKVQSHQPNFFVGCCLCVFLSLTVDTNSVCSKFWRMICKFL